jgi:hypothetical protein
VAIISTFLFMLGLSLTASLASSDVQDEAAFQKVYMHMWQFGGPIDVFGEFTTAAYRAQMFKKLSNKCSHGQIFNQK